MVSLVELADRVPLTHRAGGGVGVHAAAASARDSGRVLRDVAVTPADGGGCVSDVAAFEAQERLVGARA